MLSGLRGKNLHTWLGGYGRAVWRSWQSSLRSPLHGRPRGPRHLLFALCDHFEPLWGHAEERVGEIRVRHWLEQYPEMTEPFRDADGQRPQHTFFFPAEQYRPAAFDMLEELVRTGCGEVEVHLHHHDSSEAELRRDLTSFVTALAERGHLGRDGAGRARYAFIHGNWALANARPDGRRCGVDGELPVLFETGCYADFTFPSAPDVSQPNIVNQIYWPVGDLHLRRAHESGERARVGQRFDDRILLVQGPLALSPRLRPVPIRIENGALTAVDPETPRRVRTWLAQHIHVEGRPEWVFVKAYTHGAPERQAASLLGAGGRALHRALGRCDDSKRWRLHYVTAREMFNIAIAAMDGRSGDPGAYRDYVLGPPPLRARRGGEP